MNKKLKAQVPLSEMFGYSDSLEEPKPRAGNFHNGVQKLQRVPGIKSQRLNSRIV